MIVVRVPAVPNRLISPNSHVHWRKRHAASREDKLIARLATSSTMNESGFALELADSYAMTIEIAWPKGRNRLDIDNATAACKYFIDGFCGAIGIDDSSIYRLTVIQSRDRDGRGWTEMTLTPERSKS